jgi:hypothetical protein
VGRSIVARYFPDRHHSDDSEALDYFAREQFAAKLLDFGESSFFERRINRDLHAYRILFLPSLQLFGDYVLRIERDETIVAERKVRSPCADGRSEGVAVVIQRGAVSDSVWTRLVACMEASFWTAKLETEPDIRSLETDGWTTMIEGVRNGKHHVLRRHLQCSNAQARPTDAGLCECVNLAHAALERPDLSP